MSLTASEARERALEKMGDLQRLSKELSAIMDELPLPSPEEFEAMRGKSAPWAPEAYMAAVIRNAEYHIDEARVILNDHSPEDEESLAAAWREGRPPAPYIERSLRYLVEARSGESIAPSQKEEIYFHPHKGTEALMSAVLGRLIRIWLTRPRR
jgi:hypothetical protein